MSKQANFLKGVAVLALASGVILLSTEARGSDTPGFDYWGDFATLSKDGFTETVNGDFPNLIPNIGDSHNSYAWSMEEHNGELYVGTVRYLDCFLGFGGGDCPEPADGGFIPDLDESFAAQIWKYTPGAALPVEGFSNDNAVNGTWELQHESDLIPFWVALFSGGLLEGDEPIDFGYRNLKSCQTDGDTEPVLYSLNLGLWARVQYLSGDNWLETNGHDILDVLGSLIDGSQDLGGRGFACFKGRLWYAPAGYIDPVGGLDPDIPGPGRGIVLANSDPTGSGNWIDASGVNFEPPPPAEGGDPKNIIGVFTMNAWDVNNNGSLDDPEDLLVAGAVDRDNGGHLMVTRAEDCPPYPCTWQELGVPGAARPEVLDKIVTIPPFGSFETDLSEGVVDNAGMADMDQLGHDMYVTMSESAVTDGGLAEIVRYHTAASPNAPLAGSLPPTEGVCVAGNNPGDDQICDVTWDVVVGYPRDIALAGAANGFACGNPQDVDLIAGDDYCFPTSGLGLGAATEPLTGDDTGDPLDNYAAGGFGAAFYFWRTEVHPDEVAVEGADDVLYVTTFEQGFFVGEDEPGWNLWKTWSSSNGNTWESVFKNAAGHSPAYGGRSIKSTSNGLYIGSADPNEGTDVILGTTAPAAGSYPPVVIAQAGAPSFFGVNYSHNGVFLSDDDNVDYPDDWTDTEFNFSSPAGDDVETAALNGLATGLFGATITNYEWYYATDVTSFEGGPCSGLGIANYSHVTDPETTADATTTPDTSTTTYYTLRVTDSSANVACDSVPVEVSSDIPPFSIVKTEPPLTNDGGEPRLYLVDWNNNGSEIFRALGECFDIPDDLASCEWNFPQSDDVQLETTPDDLDQMMQAAREDLAADSTPEIDLLAIDNTGFDNIGDWGDEVDDDLGNMDVQVQSTADATEGVNDNPFCQNSAATVMAGSYRIIDPSGGTLAGSPQLCGDPEGDTLTYELRSGGPNFGTTEIDGPTGFPKYVHTEGTPVEGISPFDYFHFRAVDSGGPDNGPTVIVGLHIDSPGLTLEIVPPVEGFSPGGSIEFQVSGLSDGERARIYFSKQISPGDGACAPAGSPCLNLTGTIAQIQTSPASGGVANRVINIPPGAMTGQYLIQAIVPRGGPGFGSSLKSNIVTFDVVPFAGP